MPRAATDVRTLATAVVDLDAVAANTAILAQRAGVATMAVVKADGFGHGCVPAARAAMVGGATWLGVTSNIEARHLRDAGITAPILTWMHAVDEDFGWAIEAGVDLSVSTLAHLNAIESSARRLGAPAVVHLKVDTGLARNGMAWSGWPELVRAARAAERAAVVIVRGVWSHLISGDRPGDRSVAEQVTRFDAAVGVARAAGLDPALRHLANSAAILSAPQTHFDLVRAGIALYGVEPIAGRAHGLRPAMTLRTQVINVKRVPAGAGVSYDHEYRTAGETTLALLPVGFADGVPRLAGRHAEVAIGGRRCRVAGRVTMDQFVVEVGDQPVAIGDEAVLFGPGDDGEPLITEWAGWAQTNPHEVLTGIGDRVARQYRPVSAQRSAQLSAQRSAQRRERTGG